MSAQIIPLHGARAQRANGAFAAVNIAARRMGLDESIAYSMARQAKRDVLTGAGSAASVVSRIKASMREQSEGLLA